jgi:hypothetical protein
MNRKQRARLFKCARNCEVGDAALILKLRTVVMLLMCEPGATLIFLATAVIADEAVLMPEDISSTKEEENWPGTCKEEV